MIKIICDVCRKIADDGYVTRKTWCTLPESGYVEETIHVCKECNEKIKNFIINLVESKEK